MPEDFLKEQLKKEIDALPENVVREVLDFIGYLQTKRSRPGEPLAQPILSEDDPLAEIIGAVEVEPFADSIDDELYDSV